MKEKIINLFLYDKKLKFNEIEKKIPERSNKIAYHLKKLVKEGFIKKEKERYSLSDKQELTIPHISDKNSVLAIILIAISNKEKIFLIKRSKRPFNNNKWCMPGGRIIAGETIKQATHRIISEKYGIKCKYLKTHSVSLEQAKKGDKIMHTFLLIFVSAKTDEKLDYKTVNKKRMIESDYYLIKNKMHSELKIDNLNSQI
ncbi:MAG: NUDIX domain-containing protein [Nanoarchaeota archaeon]